MEVSALVKALLNKRGIERDDEIEAFLNPDYVSHTYAPELFANMDVATARVLEAIEHDERIAVYADFDCDGIPGAAIIHELFAKLGYENIEVYLPHRDREGYGFHLDAIDALASHGVSLIITVDVGTTAIDAVRHAKEKGIDVIVTDHHEIPGELPAAIAVLNPKLAPYPFPHLCGAGVAFKFAQALLTEGKKRGIDRFTAIPDGWEKWLLDLVAIATVADMVPLIGENRALVFFGLTVLRKSQRPGINALCAALRLRKSEITEDDIGFSIAPRINAASRMDDPDLAFRLLTTKYAPEAEMLAAQLEKLNASRKGVVASVVREANKRVSMRYANEDALVVLGDPEWKPALLGLAANSIMQSRGGVVCLWGRDALGRIKGSCRSDGCVSVVELFSNAPDAVDEFGGHEMSGGFSVSHDKVHELQDRLAQSIAALTEEKFIRTIRAHDLAIRLPDISWSLYREVSRLAPFGAGNPKPAFLIEGATVSHVKRFGKASDHVELTLAADSCDPVRAFDFFKAPENFSAPPKVGSSARLIATLERDSFRGPAQLALRIVDVLA